MVHALGYPGTVPDSFGHTGVGARVPYLIIWVMRWRTWVPYLVDLVILNSGRFLGTIPDSFGPTLRYPVGIPDSFGYTELG